MTKINNYYLSNDAKNIILVYDNYTCIFNIKTNKETKIIDESLEKIVFSDNNYLSGIYDNFNIFSYNLETKEKSGDLLMNLSKNDLILKIAYCKDNYLIIFTKQGYIYHFKNNHINLYNNINQINTSNPIINMDFSKDFDYLGILCQEYFFLLIDNQEIVHLTDLYFKNNNITKIRFCPFDNKVFYLISDTTLFKFKINYQMKVISKIDQINIQIKDILFNKFNKKLLIINSKDISYLYCMNNLENFVLLLKIKNPNVKFYSNYELFYFNSKLVIKNYLYHLIRLELNAIDEKRNRIKKFTIKNYKTMIELMNNQVLQYDHAIECKEIEYIKKIHLFIFLSKIPYFFNLHKEHNTIPLQLPIKKSLPEEEAIDQFIKYVYTDVFPDGMVIFKNLDFFKEISDKLWYGKNNQLKIWVDKIDKINKEYIL